MLNLLKLSKLFVFSFVIFTFLTSIFVSRYYDHYEKGDIAVYNFEVMHGLHEVKGEKDCAIFKEPLWGMSTYHRLLPLSFSMVVISALFILITFVISFIKKGILSKKRDKIIFVCLIILVLWSNWMLMGAGMGMYPGFYNCAKIY